ncbi:maleylacetoacetate isomerase [Bordetella tumulicola]|uniref:maleylacetoacetate isomerase n=1 Tax=Bordetella tumulicola TaxID=1649133 RepID=UPI0039EFE291
MQLYSFFNSSTSYRVRIALALKGLPHDYTGVNIRAREHRNADYEALNPSRGVPLLRDGELTLGQSMAIIDYLDTQYPETRLIPLEQPLRARVLELSNAIANDIHPVNNLRILRYLQDELGVSAAQKDTWYKHWIHEGMMMVEDLLAQHGGGPYCFGDAPTVADCCLVPQIANAQRMGCDLSAFPRALAVHAHCQQQPAFVQAAPSAQPDFA